MNTYRKAFAALAILALSAPGILLAQGNVTQTPAIVAEVLQTGKSAAISTATLCAAQIGACAVPGQYRIHADMWGSGTACSTAGSGAVAFTVTWTDENGTAHSAVVPIHIYQSGASTTATGASMAAQTALANEGASVDLNISTNGAVIQYSTTYTACTTGTLTYNLRAFVTSLQ